MLEVVSLEILQRIMMAGELRKERITFSEIDKPLIIK
jgi:hypothetical protein